MRNSFKCILKCANGKRRFVVCITIQREHKNDYGDTPGGNDKPKLFHNVNDDPTILVFGLI